MDGRINGVRIRRNFKTQEEAAAEKAAVAIKAEKAATGLSTVITPLSVHVCHPGSSGMGIGAHRDGRRG